MGWPTAVLSAPDTDETPGWFTTARSSGPRVSLVNRFPAGGVYPGMPLANDPGQGTAVTPEQRLMTALHDQHAGALYAFALRYVDDRDQARDIVQETLLRAWRHLDKLDPEHTDPRAYLFTVARNLLTDQWRATQRRPRLVHDDVRLEAQPAPDELDDVIQGWLVSAALDRLTPQHREVIEALYYRGNSVASAAADLGLPEGTVKSRTYYAMRALRAIFEEIGVTR
ncbi:sigma-70 family RNA polymerase sigma factor [Lapillicoccus sp.]|uniref:sigma-70 family RNA polymerase sigma factor n=1 Tax=Lapillicoccus sp. TaxID=1909287 RepID=UPI003983968F